MSGNEVVDRAKEAYEVGLFSYEQMEKWVERGVRAGEREVSGAILYLPFEWEIRRAVAAL